MLRLELDGGPSVDLDELELLHITEVDFGFPEVREVVEPRPNADGVIDRTKYVGSRVVTLTGKIGIDFAGRGRRQAVIDQLAPFLHPGVRPWLYSRSDDGHVRRVLLRADDFSRPQIANVEDISLSFKSAGGYEDENVQEVRIVPEVVVRGRRYPLTFDRVYPSGSGTATLLTNRGNAPADWTARIFGPCTAPAIVNVTTGEQVRLGGLHLNPGEFVEVSSRDHTVLADGLRTSSRWHTVDYVQTTWWQLPAGASAIRFRVGWFEIPAALFFAWRETNLL